MTTNFPSSLDNFTNPASTDLMNSVTVPHNEQHANANDAIEALQAKVGIDSSADTSSHDYLIGDLLSRIATLEAAGSPIVKVAAFTSSGTWTVPAGVTYAIAHMRGGGGGANFGTGNANQGGTSSVAFSSGTVIAGGGSGVQSGATGGVTASSVPATNSGEGGHITQGYSPDGPGQFKGQRGAYIVAGAAVTPAASITVTVGAGGTGNSNGAAGYVWIEYQES